MFPGTLVISIIKLDLYNPLSDIFFLLGFWILQVTGAIPYYAERFVDPAMGFAGVFISPQAHSAIRILRHKKISNLRKTKLFSPFP
jgi:hypothetical protein